MTLTKRLMAYALSLTAGYAVPLMALAAVEDGINADQLTFHTSSRAPAYQMDATQEEMEALRMRLWALTVHGGTANCVVDGVTAPCADNVAFDQVD